ncbi:restriction endonuclease subunit S [Aliiglaciecola lipolytica]|uniref:Type I restriction enzyme, S subunit n=1 Tax=Aliiglaciecola lipolytica E3 TaxID=1127673 RepID=K6XNF8_9ALTE|nr:restriction endonuclease subunit S [Aliiglaciecola lipolytica]GAC13221.1 type I restriction enzyme, S subunit [Aliiglaciecola lipolytica E3]
MSVTEQQVPEGFNKTEVGIIPDKWEIHLLNDISVISRLAGAEYSSMWKENPAGEIIALRGFNIGKNRIINRELTRIDNSLSLKLKRSRLTKGDVIYPCVGSIGNAAVIYENDKYHIQQNIARITPKQEKLYSEYLCHFLMSELAFKEVERFTATTSQPSVLVSSLRQYRVPVPETLKEQTAIANALSDVDALLTELEKLIAKKQAIKTATMQQLLTGKTRLPQFATYTEGKKQGQSKGTKPSDLGEIPEDWKVVTLDEAANFFDGQRRPLKSGDRARIKGQYPYYGASGIVDYVNDFIFDGEFILLGEDGENILSRSLPLAFKASGKIWVNNHAHVMTPKKNYHIDFLIPYLESLDYSLLNSGTAQPKLNKQSCLNIKVIKPSIEEQTAIATILSDIDEEIQTLEHRLKKTRQIKQGMMQELLTGKTRLPF